MDENEIYEALGVKPPEAGEARLQGAGEAAQAPVSGEDADRAVVGESPMTRADGGTAEAPPQEETGGGEGAEPQESQGSQESPEEPHLLQEEQDGADGIQGPSLSDLRSANDRSRHSPDGERQEARWRAMTEQAVSRALEAERARNQAQWDEFFASAGLKNNLDGGKPITSLDEFHAWKTRYDRMRLERDLQEGKLSPEAFEAAVRAEVERAAARPATGQTPGGDAAGQTPPAAAPQRAAAQVTQAQIDAELAEIHRLDGSVSGLADILKMDTGGAFRDAVRRGHSFLDAFKLANFDRLQNARQNEAAQRAAQAARNSARSKDHLRASVGGGKEGAAAVPGDVMELYRQLMPKATDAEISGHYNRMLRETNRGG